MAGRSRLCSCPEEILFYIVKYLRSPQSPLQWVRLDGLMIRFANDQVLQLSQVNHLFRRLCLPLLYEHIIIRLTTASLPATNGSTHGSPFDLFRRTMERKPHLADLVRVFEFECFDTSHHVFDSLPFLPKIKRIVFPPNVKLDLDLLSMINSHPSLLTVHWERTTAGAFSFPNPLSLPHGALSRVLIDREELSEDSNSIELLWLYFAKLGLRAKILTLTDTTPPPFLSLTYPDLRSIHIDVTPVFSSDSPEPLGWFPSFLERHPQLEVFWIRLKQGGQRLSWEALKNVPIIKPLYDASQSRGLISSFSFASILIGIKRFSSSYAALYVDSPQVLPKILHLLGSLLVIPEIILYFRTPEPHFLPINVNDFVSAFQENYKILSSLCLCDVCEVLDLDSLSTDEELHFNDTNTEEDVLGDPHLRDRTKQLAQLIRLLNAGLPQLKQFNFHERDFNVDDELLGTGWQFSVSGDGQVELDQVEFGEVDLTEID